MDYESERSTKLGCWNGVANLTPAIEGWKFTEATPDFEIDPQTCDFIISSGMGEDCPQEMREFWRKEIPANYRGDDGRKRARMCAVNLRDRDGLYGRLFDVKCPVLWMHVSTRLPAFSAVWDIGARPD